MDGVAQLNPSIRRSLDAECHTSTTSGNGTGSTGSNSPSSTPLLMRPRAFARQLSDDLRRRRQSFATSTGNAKKCYSPLASSSSSGGGAAGAGGAGGGAAGVCSHRHSMAGIVGYSRGAASGGQNTSALGSGSFIYLFIYLVFNYFNWLIESWWVQRLDCNVWSSWAFFFVF